MNKWIFVGSLGAVFLFTLGFSYGPGYGGGILAFLGNNSDTSTSVSPSDMVTPVVTQKKVVTSGSVTNVTTVSPSMSPLPYNNDAQYYSESPVVTPVSSNVTTVSPRPSVTLSVSPSPSPTVTPRSVTTSTPQPSVTPFPTPTPIQTQSPIPTSVPETNSVGSVVINEIAWMGTKASQYAEWIELYNTAGNSIDLSGWKIIENNSGAIVVTLSGLIQANGYYIIERVTTTSPHVFKDLTANISGSFGGGGLSNSGEKLTLYDSSENVIDTVDGSAQWYGTGTASPDYKSMERIDPRKSGGISNNWGTNNGLIVNGINSDGGPVNGTPGTSNSVATP